MVTLTESELRSGIIFGDTNTAEYVYMPASELGAEQPLCVYETDDKREDMDIEHAIKTIRRRSLKPVNHPMLGKTSC
ncbi:MAG: hypothetical protein J6M33_08995 [Anaerovibrio sp.]|nr:hypothetical protein [Anaerovibrio sp.]